MVSVPLYRASLNWVYFSIKNGRWEAVLIVGHLLPMAYAGI
jgi:hypothetical protein